MLHKYDMVFTRYSSVGKVFVEELSVNRARFTSREFKKFVVTELFSLASRGFEYYYVNCDVFCDGIPILYSHAITSYYEASSLFVDIDIARPGYGYTLYRVMTLAK